MERNDALTDVENLVKEYGECLTYRSREESDVTRDKLGSIISRKGKDFGVFSFPIIQGPTRDQLEKAGLKEEGDLVVWLPTKTLDRNKKDFNSIDHTRDGMFFNNAEYEIKDKSQQSQFKNVFLYVTLSLKKIG